MDLAKLIYVDGMALAVVVMPTLLAVFGLMDLSPATKSQSVRPASPHRALHPAE